MGLPWIWFTWHHGESHHTFTYLKIVHTHAFERCVTFRACLDPMDTHTNSVLCDLQSLTLTRGTLGGWALGGWGLSSVACAPSSLSSPFCSSPASWREQRRGGPQASSRERPPTSWRISKVSMWSGMWSEKASVFSQSDDYHLSSLDVVWRIWYFLWYHVHQLAMLDIVWPLGRCILN